jgi:hypothetical protein
MIQAALAREDEYLRRADEQGHLSQKTLDEQRVGRQRATWVELYRELEDFRYEAQRIPKIRFHYTMDWRVDPPMMPRIDINIVSQVDQSIIYNEKLPATEFPSEVLRATLLLLAK